jgi:hypothetical protein
MRGQIGQTVMMCDNQLLTIMAIPNLHVKHTLRNVQAIMTTCGPAQVDKS